VNTEAYSRTPLTHARRRVWPYVVGTAAVAALASAIVCYRLWTAPTPAGVSDESSFGGELIVKIVMAGCVAACTGVGALLGWLIGYLVRVLLPLSSET
jgi:hypothetical protein